MVGSSLVLLAQSWLPDSRPSGAILTFGFRESREAAAVTIVSRRARAAAAVTTRRIETQAA